MANGLRLATFTKMLPGIGTTPLHLAVEEGNLARVQQCIEAGIDVNLPDAVGRTLLEYAVRFFQVEIGHYLLSKGANGEIIWNNLPLSLYFDERRCSYIGARKPSQRERRGLRNYAYGTSTRYIRVNCLDKELACGRVRGEDKHKHVPDASRSPSRASATDSDEDSDAYHCSGLSSEDEGSVTSGSSSAIIRILEERLAAQYGLHLLDKQKSRSSSSSSSS